MQATTAQLARAIRGRPNRASVRPPRPLTYSRGVVSASNSDGSVTVALDGSAVTLNARVLANSNVAVNDTVEVLKGGTSDADDPRVLGVLSAAPGTRSAPSLLGIAGTPLVGTAPAIGAGHFYVQAGNTVISFSSGDGSLSFPTAFPSGVLAGVAMPNIGAADVTLSMVSATTSTMTLYATLAGAALGSAMTVCWLAIGF